MIFLVFSMKRSGHHAVINWMMAQSKGSRHFNNCKIKNGVIVSKKGRRVKNGKHLIICNFEDRPVIAPFKNVKYIVILRDPFNLVASRLRSTHPKMGTIMQSTWKQHVKMALKGEPVIDVNYNKWFKDVNYRHQLSDKLGLTFTDVGLDKVPKIGGSSFDGYKYDGRAQQMDVLNRWKPYIHDDRFWREIDSEMINLSRQYFDFVVNRGK